ncbi:MAG TPA: zf-HC2 domain-containing protein [Solirubrobacterales bacterium]|nr:zf-HC2 domain-containing protein [Solirubrobacterales bacterium]
MTCQEFVEVVTEYLEGALTEERRAQLHAHIDECGGCTNYLQQMRTTIAALATLPPENGFREPREAAMEAFRRLRARESG